MQQKIIISGAQVTGNLHIGNYIGALKQWVFLQKSHKCFFFLANLHSLTTEIPPEELYNNTINTAAIYIAAGIDYKKSIIFPQSLVPEHSELAWIFNCITPLGWLKRMTQFKDKATNGQDNANLGLLSYPVLMAADILLYKGNLVPVGKDQKQHLELTRDIAGAMNRRFGYELFPFPEPIILEDVSKIMSLKDGTKKMSKSDLQELSRVNLIDDNDKIAEKIKKAKTDNIPYLSYDPINRPEVSNLLNIYTTFSSFSKEQIIEQYSTENNFAKFKKDLADIIINYLAPFQKNYQNLINNKDYINNILINGALEARESAINTLKEVKQGLGII